MPRIRRTLTVAVLATAAVAASSTAAEAAPCFADFPRPGGGTWEIQNDGSMEGALVHGGGSALDEGHGRLAVDGVAYPAIPNPDSACTVTSTRIDFPTRTVDTLKVTRSIELVDGKLRWIDTLKNDGPLALFPVDHRLEVLPSQVITETESGDDKATAQDHWTVHSSQNAIFPFLQWGEGIGAVDPAVLPEDAGPAWEDDFGTMDDDATLRYPLVIATGETVRLLHIAGAGSTETGAKAAATNTVAPFKGLTQAVASRVVNWGDDPDGDGVGKAADACPGVVGDLPSGCKKLIIDLPPAPEPPAPAPQPPAPAPPAPAPLPVPPGGETGLPGTSGASANAIALRGLGKAVRRSTLTGKGVALKVRCATDCRLETKIRVRRKGRKQDTTILTVTRRGLTSSERTVRLKVSKRSMRRLARQQIVVRVKATDADGTSTMTRRTVRVK